MRTKVSNGYEDSVGCRDTAVNYSQRKDNARKYSGTRLHSIPLISIILWYTLAALNGGQIFWEFVLVTLNECPGAVFRGGLVRNIRLFCWADASAKTSLDWQKEVRRSHRNIPIIYHCEGVSPEQSPRYKEMASLLAKRVARNDIKGKR